MQFYDVIENIYVNKKIPSVSFTFYLFLTEILIYFFFAEQANFFSWQEKSV